MEKKRLGTIGVDNSERHQPDVLHDLNCIPYPFQASSVDYIYMDNVLEHLDSPLSVMEEIYRILKPGSCLKIIVPYFRSIWAFTDPTHKHFFAVDSFSYYDPSHQICQRYDYTSAAFQVQPIVFNETLRNGALKSVIARLANKHPRLYERYLSHLIPLDDITYYLQKI